MAYSSFKTYLSFESYCLHLVRAKLYLFKSSVKYCVKTGDFHLMTDNHASKCQNTHPIIIGVYEN